MVSKTMAAIFTILQEAGGSIHRTKLLKLVYLADSLHYEHLGTTITGLGYMWDNFGPNAVSNAIVKEAEKLVQSNYACMKVGTSIYGSENSLYSIGPRSPHVPPNLLTPLQIQILRDVVQRYRNYSIREIVAASKKTKPFKTARQYEILQLSQSPSYEALIGAVRSNSQFMAGVVEGTQSGAEAQGMRLEEVRHKYGL